MKSEKIEGVVLSAGKSTRMGKFKMTLPLGDKSIIQHSVESMYDVCDRIIVVTGYEAEQIHNALKNYDKIELVNNPDYERGMFSSVKVGISRVKGARFFLLPGDCPSIPSYVYLKMIKIEDKIVVPAYRGKNGHPVLIDSELIPQILNEPENSNLKFFINRVGYSTVEIDEKCIIMDIDDIQDYERAKTKYTR